MRISDWSSDVCSSDLDNAVEHIDAGSDKVDLRHLPRRRDDPEQVGEVDRGGKTFDRTERRGEIHVGRGEAAGLVTPSAFQAISQIGRASGGDRVCPYG